MCRLESKAGRARSCRIPPAASKGQFVLGLPRLPGVPGEGPDGHALRKICRLLAPARTGARITCYFGRISKELTYSYMFEECTGRLPRRFKPAKKKTEEDPHPLYKTTNLYQVGIHGRAPKAMAQNDITIRSITLWFGAEGVAIRSYLWSPWGGLCKLTAARPCNPNQRSKSQKAFAMLKR